MRKLLLLIVAVMFAAVTLPACSDDDKGNNNPPTQTDDSDDNDDKDDAPLFVGTWEFVHHEYNSAGNEVVHDVVQGDSDWHIMTVKADRTFVMKFSANDTETGTYSIVGNTVTILYDGDGDSEVDVMTIKTLTATTLVLEEVGQKDGVPYKEVFTYKRI